MPFSHFLFQLLVIIIAHFRKKSKPATPKLTKEFILNNRILSNKKYFLDIILCKFRHKSKKQTKLFMRI